jgi:polyisoprenoid-binding protein YceI
MSSTAPELTYFPSTWRIDPTRSELRFSIRHLGIRNQRGTVTGLSGELVIGTDLASSSVTATIDLSSVDTGFAMRDKAIRSPKLLDVDTHPTATYRSTAVRGGLPGEDFLMEGELTFLGVTKKVPLRFRATSLPTRDDLTTPSFVAQAELLRADFGFVLHEGPAFMDRSLGAVIQFEIRLEGAPV